MTTALAVISAAIALLGELPEWTEAAANLKAVLLGQDVTPEQILDLEAAEQKVADRCQQVLDRQKNAEGSDRA